jgi:hypothetical protein
VFVVPQRTFIGNIEPKHEKPMVYVVADDLKVISAPGGEQDLGETNITNCHSFLFSHLASLYFIDRLNVFGVS